MVQNGEPANPNLVWFIKDIGKFVEIGEQLIKERPELNNHENKSLLFSEICLRDKEAVQLIGFTNMDGELLAANLRENGIRAKCVKPNE